MLSTILQSIIAGVLGFFKRIWDAEAKEAAEDRAEALAAREEAAKRAKEAQDKIDEAGDTAGHPNPEDVDVEEALNGLSNFSKKGEE